MGILSFLGMIVSFSAIIAGILYLEGNVAVFLDPASALLVMVPTVGSLVATYPIKLLAKVPAHMKIIVRKEKKPEEYIEKIVELANKVRSGGLLAFKMKN